MPFGDPCDKIGISPELSITFWNAIHQIEGNHLLFNMNEKSNIQIRTFEIITFLNIFHNYFFNVNISITPG